MPNWDDGGIWWAPVGEPWYNQVQIPHPPSPFGARENCACAFCCHARGVPMVKFVVSYPAGLDASKEHLRNLLDKAGDTMAMVEEMG